MNNMVERVVDWNLIAGNYRGDLEHPPWTSVYRQYELLREEFKETQDALDSRDITEVVDGAVDCMVVCIGLMNRLGLSKDQVNSAIDEVLSSNESKFTTDKRVALESADRYIRAGVAVEVSKSSPYILKVSGGSNPEYPIGKILKVDSYVKPDLESALRETLY